MKTAHYPAFDDATRAINKHSKSGQNSLMLEQLDETFVLFDVAPHDVLFITHFLQHQTVNDIRFVLSEDGVSARFTVDPREARSWLTALTSADAPGIFVHPNAVSEDAFECVEFCLLFATEPIYTVYDDRGDVTICLHLADLEETLKTISTRGGVIPHCTIYATRQLPGEARQTIEVAIDQHEPEDVGPMRDLFLISGRRQTNDLYQIRLETADASTFVTADFSPFTSL